jgi:sugar lactone lactonase YvrE
VVELAAGVESVVDTGNLLNPTAGNPDGLVLDAAGDLFIADANANDIVEVPAGGSGAVVYSTSGITLSAPQGLAVDSTGHLYIADAGNNRIATVTPGGVGGTITISCGTALSGPRGVAVDGSGSVYIADTGNSRIVKVTDTGSCTAPTSTQPLSHPAGVAVDYWGGSVYIANSVDGNLVELLESPISLGDVQVGSSSPTTVILPFTLGTGVTLGSAKVLTMGTASLDFTAVATGTTCQPGSTAGACNVNVQFSPTTAGLRKGTVVLFNNANVPILTIPIYGTGNAPLAALTPGNTSVVNGTGPGLTDSPAQVALDGAGNMYVANEEDGNVVKVPAGGGTATVVSTSPIVLGNPDGVVLDAAGNLYIADSENGDVVKVTPAGVVTTFVTLANNGAPGPMAMDLAGNLYVVDLSINNYVVKITPAGVQSPVSTGGIQVGATVSVAVDAAGTVYIDDEDNEDVIKVTAAGAASVVTLPGILGTGQDNDQYIDYPVAVSVDGMGNVYIIDIGQYPTTIWEVTTGGQTAFEQFFNLSPWLNNPQAVAVDGNGNLFISDTQNNRIVEVAAAAASQQFSSLFVGSQTNYGTITTVTNLGNLPLTIAANSPTYTVIFPEDTDFYDYSYLCGSDTALGAGEICDVDTYFAPQSVGAHTANILVTDNSLNGTNVTQSISVSGIGLAADSTTVTVTTLFKAFSGQPITITAVVNDTANGDPGGIPTGSVTFTDTVGVTNTPLNGGNPVMLDRTGTATLTGALLSGGGSHTITAYYSGVPNMFVASSNTTSILITAPLVSAVTLNIAPGSSVVAGTAATLTATVTANSVPVTAGTVLFCNAAAAQCDGAAVYGSAQLTSAGTAAIKLTLGVGVYSIAAAFQATSPTLAGVSAPQPFTVTANAGYSSFTTIAATGSSSDYTLTGTVTTFGAAPPSGTVSFLNTSNGSASLGAAALNPATLLDTFIPAVGSPLPVSNAWFVVTGDFNHDGIPDLAVLSSAYSGIVSVFLGNGDGTFQAAVTYSVGTQPQSIVVSDVNDDGNLDLIVANEGNADVGVLLGNSNGTFQPQTTSPVGNNPVFVAVGDFNGDGVTDLAVANLADNTVGILLGLGDGTFQTQVTYSVPNPIGIAVADFNHDGILDLAVTGSTEGSIVAVLQGVGDGTFTQPNSPINIPANNAGWLAAGDLRNSGTMDLVVPDRAGSNVYVLLGNGNLTFQTAVAYAGVEGPWQVALGDVNGDGVLDLVAPNTEADGLVSVLLGNGDGTFAAATNYTVGNNPASVALADFNGDGLLDFATADLGSNTSTVLLGAQTETASITNLVIYGSGTDNVLASYSGDANRAPSVSSTVQLTALAQTVTVTTFTAEPNPAFSGQVVTLTATVTPAPIGSAPTGSAPIRRPFVAFGPIRSAFGTLSFFNGTTLLGSVNLDASGLATFTSSTLPVGALSVTAVYSGNTSSAGSSSIAQTVTILPLPGTPTTTTLGAAPNPANSGQTVTLTATVAPAPTGTPVGTVSFFNGTTLLGMGTPNSSGIATFTTSTLPTGPSALTGAYSGNSGFAASTSAAVIEIVVNPAATTTATSLTALPNPAIVGQSVALTATVSPAPTGSPLGTVSFYSGSTLLSIGSVNSSGVATISSVSLPAGLDSLTAVYSGNTGFAASTSTAVQETVNSPTAAATTTTLIALPNPAIVGQSVTLTATIAPAPTGTPAGTVSFYSGTTLLGATAVNSGVAAFITSSLPAGGLSMTAVYSGNAGFAASTSTALTEVVTAPAATATTTTLTASPNPLFDGQSATLTATVTPAPTGTPAGIVTFYSGTTSLGTGMLNASGVATLTLSSLVVGADSITAAYPGNSGFAASTSSAVGETVTTAYTITAPTTPIMAAPGATVTVNITVPPLGGAFNSVVTLSASGLPPGATATFNPPTVTPGSAGAPTVLTIQLATLAAGKSAGDIPTRHNGLPLVPFTLGFAVFGAVLGRKRIPRTLVLGLALAVLGVSTLFITGCGGGFANTPSTPAGNYTVTVTGTSGAFQASTTITLVVE